MDAQLKLQTPSQLIFLTLFLLGCWPGLSLGQVELPPVTFSVDSHLYYLRGPEVRSKLSEFTISSLSRLRTLADTGDVAFPDIHILSTETADTLPDDMALVQLRDNDLEIKLRSDHETQLHWHGVITENDSYPFRMYRALVPAGQQTLKLYYKWPYCVDIPIDLDPGQVLTLSHKWTLIDSAGEVYAHDKDYQSLEVCGPLRWPAKQVIYPNNTDWLLVNFSGSTYRGTYSVKKEFWPSKAREEGKSGVVTLHFDWLPTGDLANIEITSETPRDWGFADAARRMITNRYWMVLDTSYTYAPYRSYREFIFNLAALPDSSSQ